MDKATRAVIQKATKNARSCLETEFREQLDGRYDIRAGRPLPAEPGAHLDADQRRIHSQLVATLEHLRLRGANEQDAVDTYVREAAFTTLNRLAALKMLEARALVKPCVSNGPASTGFKEFSGLAPGLQELPDKGYRLYLECLFDEIAVEVKVLFDRRDPAALLWPRDAALAELLAILNRPELAIAWAEDETIGWIYQYFNSSAEREAMRKQSSVPRNSRELAVRNQFFTPRYVVEFLTDNTLGRTWYEMRAGQTRLTDQCQYLVHEPDERFDPPRPPKDPRELRILDPACGSGHFLLYAFDLLLTIYEEAFGTGATADPPPADWPGLILARNLHGIDIDPRAAQIAALALWMRAQRALTDLGLGRAERPRIERTNIVVAEPMPGDSELLAEFLTTVDPRLQPLVSKAVDAMKLAGEAGSLLKIEADLEKALGGAMRAAMVPRAEIVGQTEDGRQIVQATLSMIASSEEDFWDQAQATLLASLAAYGAQAAGATGLRRRLFAQDAAEGFAFIALMHQTYDVVLMNPPFGAASKANKSYLSRAYPRTKNDLFAAFVERGIALLEPGAFLGALTSRTGFFLVSFQAWREEILLATAPPTVFADLGNGVLDDAMVEVAAFCLQKKDR